MESKKQLYGIAKLVFLGDPKMILEDGTEVKFQIDYPMLVLAYVTLKPNAFMRRDDLATLFYPDTPDTKASQNIRQVLHRLRIIIKDDEREVPLLEITQTTIRVNPDAHLVIDVLQVEEAIKDAHEHLRHHAHRKVESCRLCFDKINSVVDLITGEFFEGSLPHTGGQIDDWILRQKDVFRFAYLRFLHMMVDHQILKSDLYGLEQNLERILNCDPLDEAAIRKLMLLLSTSGDPTQALSRYHAFQNYSQQALGDGLEEETMRLAYDIRNKANYTLPDQEVVEQVSFYPLNVAQYDDSIPLFGREAELASIAVYLEDKHSRVISIRGVIASGKTRLAVSVAKLAQPYWLDGVKVLLLDPDKLPNTLLSTQLVEAFGIHSTNFVEHRAKLISFLRDKEILIVIDNVEFAGEYQSLIPALMNACPKVKFLLTCRKYLNLRGELSITLEGLPILSKEERAGKSAAAIIEASPALRMFEFTALRANPNFVMNDSNIDNCIETCEMISGLPSGIELSGSYARLFNPEEIRDAVKGYFAGSTFVFYFIQGRHEDFKNKYRNAWDSLSEHERGLIELVRKYPEGVVTDDLLAENITTIETLVTLQDKSTFIRLPGSRVKLHPLVHFFF